MKASKWTTLSLWVMRVALCILVSISASAFFAAASPSARSSSAARDRFESAFTCVTSRRLDRKSHCFLLRQLGEFLTRSQGFYK